VAQPIVFFVRRILFVLALRCPIFSVKMGGMMYLVIGNISYYFMTNPFKDPMQLKLEIFNEVFLLVGLYWIPLFTDWVSGSDTRYTFGWMFVGTAIAPIFLVNLTYVTLQGAEIAKKKCRESSMKRKAKAIAK
jgi:hypothetical protein